MESLSADLFNEPPDDFPEREEKIITHTQFLLVRYCEVECIRFILTQTMMTREHTRHLNEHMVNLKKTVNRL